jgi:hypothetical protein
MMDETETPSQTFADGDDTLKEHPGTGVEMHGIEVPADGVTREVNLDIGEITPEPEPDHVPVPDPDTRQPAPEPEHTPVQHPSSRQPNADDPWFGHGGLYEIGEDGIRRPIKELPPGI